ncbi:hypothetical protein GCM10010278_79580 [Streptomyces melanogenes]|nr:hypothetical protein GCM10010278_79580 [Streptomyces melanogenes]
MVTPLWEYLRTQLPAGLDAWTVTPHLDLPFRRAAGDLLKDAYADLPDPIEVTLLGSRREGAERIEPLVKTGDETRHERDAARRNARTWRTRSPWHPPGPTTSARTDCTGAACSRPCRRL